MFCLFYLSFFASRLPRGERTENLLLGTDPGVPGRLSGVLVGVQLSTKEKSFFSVSLHTDSLFFHRAAREQLLLGNWLLGICV
jgi:hypothetical protein